MTRLATPLACTADERGGGTLPCALSVSRGTGSESRTLNHRMRDCPVRTLRCNSGSVMDRDDDSSGTNIAAPATGPDQCGDYNLNIKTETQALALVSVITGRSSPDAVLPDGPAARISPPRSSSSCWRNACGSGETASGCSDNPQPTNSGRLAWQRGQLTEQGDDRVRVQNALRGGQEWVAGVNPLGWLLGLVLPACGAAGAHGLPVPPPMNATQIVRPASPNTALAAPDSFNPPPDIVTPIYPVPADRLFGSIQAVASAQPRTFPAATYPDRLQAHWVTRSAVFNFPDTIMAQVSSAGRNKAMMVLYSRSVYGYSDLGVNRHRLATWLAALNRTIETPKER